VVFSPDFQACRYIDDSLPIDGAARNRFSDWLWSMNGARAAARSISARCGSSQAVRNSARVSAGNSVMPWTEPSACLICSRIRSVHSPCAFSSVTSAVLTCRNSPDMVSRLNRLDTCGSMHS
jgi:hypothetical protein